MKKKRFPFLFFFTCDCLRNIPHAKGAGLRRCHLHPCAQRARGSDGPQAKAGAAAGAWRQEQVCREGEDEPLGLRHWSSAGAGPGRRCPAGGAAQHGRSLQAHLHPRALVGPGLSSWFPIGESALPFAVLLAVARGAEGKSRLDLPRPHWDQRGLACPLRFGRCAMDEDGPRAST